jgi:hypothetical protein
MSFDDSLEIELEKIIDLLFDELENSNSRASKRFLENYFSASFRALNKLLEVCRRYDLGLPTAEALSVNFNPKKVNLNFNLIDQPNF